MEAGGRDREQIKNRSPLHQSVGLETRGGKLVDEEFGEGGGGWEEKEEGQGAKKWDQIGLELQPRFGLASGSRQPRPNCSPEVGGQRYIWGGGVCVCQEDSPVPKKIIYLQERLNQQLGLAQMWY